MNDLEIVLAFAREAHHGQSRREREEYVNHCIRVSETVAAYSAKAALVALLHDTLEDTSTTVEDLKSVVTDDVIEAVLLLTKTEDNKEKYLEDLLSSGNAIALAVKAADALDNATFQEEDYSFTWRVVGKDPHKEIDKYRNLYSLMKEQYEKVTGHSLPF